MFKVREVAKKVLFLVAGPLKDNGFHNVVCMVLILDGNSELGAHGRSSLYILISSRQLIRSRAVTLNSIYVTRKGLFSFMRTQHCTELPFNVSTMIL